MTVFTQRKHEAHALADLLQKDSPSGYRLLITGSRSLRDYDLVLREIVHEVGGDGRDFPATIVHGAATGADHLAHCVALHMGYTPEPHFPRYDLWPPSAAPKIRNQTMVDAGADYYLAFPTSGSRGTYDCIRKAEEAGIPGRVVSTT